MKQRDSVRLSSEGQKRLKSAIIEKGISQSEVAEQAFISRQTLSRLLSGQNVQKSVAISIFDLLNIDDPEVFLESISMIISDDIIIGSSLNQINSNINWAVQELSEATTDEVQVIASTQLQILDSYHREVLLQAKSSFRWALIISGAGFIFFLTSIVLIFTQQQNDKAMIPLISGAIIEVIAGVNFYLYGQTAKQLSSFYRKLDRTQRYLLANSICESLEGEAKQTTRSELVKTVSTTVD